MKKLLWLFLFLPLAAGAADATFTWTKPDPAFTGPVPPGVVIDEYRINCSNEHGDAYQIVVAGYDSEGFSATGLPAGVTTCSMKSYSLGLDEESLPSASITKELFEDADPNPPTTFDFSAEF